MIQQVARSDKEAATGPLKASLWAAALLVWVFPACAAWGVEFSVVPAPSTPSETETGPATPARDADFDNFAAEYSTSATAASGQRKAFDPLIGYNRFMFAVNDKFYFWLAKPMCKGYSFIVPDPGRKAIRRAFHNLYFPLRFFNNLLQFKFKGCAKETGRFVVNSTVGIGGLFDPARSWLHWEPSNKDFGQTFGFYGVGEGVPIVLPFLGQSNLRDGVGMGLNFLVNPVNYLANFQDGFEVAAGEQMNYVSLHGGDYEIIKKTTLDPYVFIRDGYSEMRKKEISK
ncbi:MAG: VacJ family lipoprotein [Elusimicrobia bacterium]|nr:VacJ family lipoprotein [Elusimicrobiota bacterium]